MELHTASRLTHTSAASRCDAYLERMGLAPAQRQEIYRSIGHVDLLPAQEAMVRLHHALAGKDALRACPALGSVGARLRHFQTAPPSAPDADDTNDCRLPRPEAAPEPSRASMVPHPWGILNPLHRWLRSIVRRPHHWVPRNPAGGPRQPWPAMVPERDPDDDVVDGPDPRGQWQRRGNVRRLLLLALMLAQTAIATFFMAGVLPYQGRKPLEMAVLALFAILFCWVSAGFWTAMTGFLVMIRGTDRFAISRHAAKTGTIDASARTAIVMPICNEDVARVIAGLRATYESVARTGELDRFDFFILSDSSDSDTCTAEVAAWAGLCRAVGGFGRIFYRRRRRRVKRKSGNLDDFCRRWGSRYRYMIVLDADSVMSGSCVTTLVRLMEASPGAGIIQTAPRAVGRETLYARIQQFATSVYGPLFTAGLHYWQLGESHYWGHNAIIRIAPFMRHCALSPLPGRGSLAGEILSHDFVEAALMRRAGWGVWIAYDLEGSYEELPPNLLDEIKRDRRWCHGNLMNFRLFTARGMHVVHRAVFLTGVMAYLSAPLWLAFLALSTVLFALHTLVEPRYFVEPRQLFPIWPQWHPHKALVLFSATATLLFLPKILGVLLVCARGARLYGGKLRVLAGMLVELLFSMLLAPVRMLFHSAFVLAAFSGWEISWRSPPRHDSQTGWGEALRKHGLHQLLGLAWGLGVFWINPRFLPWLLPIIGALLLSVPVSVLSSRVSPGRLSRRVGLFLIPEESDPPPELQAAYEYAGMDAPQPAFADAVVDPMINAWVCATGRARPALPASAREERARLLETVLQADPAFIAPKYKDIVLTDPLLLSQLHLRIWSADQVSSGWRMLIAPETQTASSMTASATAVARV